MALAKTGLGFPVSVSANSTGTIVTVASSQKVYVRGLLIHNLDTAANTTFHVYVVANGGSPTTSNKIMRGAMSASDTAFIEFAYPITLTTNGDTIRVENDSTTNAITVLPLGDKESS
jgi:hypothetical protein